MVNDHENVSDSWMIISRRDNTCTKSNASIHTIGDFLPRLIKKWVVIAVHLVCYEPGYE